MVIIGPISGPYNTGSVAEEKKLEEEKRDVVPLVLWPPRYHYGGAVPSYPIYREPYPFLKQVVVLRVPMDGLVSYFCIMAGHDARTKALRIAVSVKGVEAASLTGKDKDEIEVKGEGIDTVKLATIIRKEIGHAEIVSVAAGRQERREQRRREKT
jgi:hypothetical protein